MSTLAAPPDTLGAVAAMVTDPAVRVHTGTAHLSSPPAVADYPHVVIWGTLPTNFDGAEPGAPSLADRPDAIQAGLRLTYAATSTTSMLWLVSRVRPLVDRQRPVLPGWHVHPLKLASLWPMDQDRQIQLPGGLHPIYAIDETTLIANRSVEDSNA